MGNRPRMREWKKLRCNVTLLDEDQVSTVTDRASGRLVIHLKRGEHGAQKMKIVD
jgi:hypothetical protein